MRHGDQIERKKYNVKLGLLKDGIAKQTWGVIQGFVYSQLCVVLF